MEKTPRKRNLDDSMFPDEAQPGELLFVVERREVIGRVIQTNDGRHPIEAGLLVVAEQLVREHDMLVRDGRFSRGERQHARFAFNFEGQIIEVNAGDFAESVL